MILVTGGTGFLGAHVVCELLENNRQVRAIKRATSTLQEFNYIFNIRFAHLTEQQKAEKLALLNWTPADLLDVPSLEDAMEGVEQVYHVAAMVSFVAKQADEMQQVNVQGTTNVVNVALYAGVKKLCYCSSIAALGRAESGMTIDEKTAWTDSLLNTNYAISKYRAELEVWRAGEEGLNIVMVNPGVIIGEGDWSKGSCKMMATAAKGVPVYTEGINGYVDVRDVAKAMFLLAESNISFERFVLVSANISFKEFFSITAKATGKKEPKINAPKWLVNIAVVADALRALVSATSPLLTRETARGMYNRFFYKSDKFTHAFNFRFIPIEETIIRSSKACVQDKV